MPSPPGRRRRSALAAVLTVPIAALALAAGTATADAGAAPADTRPAAVSAARPAVPGPVTARPGARPSPGSRQVRGGIEPDDSDVAAVAASRRMTRTAAAALVRTQAQQAVTADRLLAELGAGRTGGAYFDAADRLVVTVTDEAGATRVRSAGALPRTVARSTADLERVRASFDTDRGLAGTTWGLDATTNQVVLTLPQAAPTDPAGRDRLGRLEATAGRHGDAVRVERRAGETRAVADVAGGDAIFPSIGTSCSAGFTVSNGINNFVLTAGHCLRANQVWDNWLKIFMGPSYWWYYPNEDDGLIRIDSAVDPLGGIWLYNGIVRSVYGGAYAKTGQTVCKSGKATHVTCGKVRGTGLTINTDGGTVYGMDSVNLCAEPGDSGGSLFTGNIALAETSASRLDANDRCLTGSAAEAYFYPVIPGLDWYGVWLIGGP